MKILPSRYMIPLVFLSMRKGGSRVCCQGVKAEVPAVLSENILEIISARNTFCSCILNYVLEHSWQPYTEMN